jgi:hypothetical protein
MKDWQAIAAGLAPDIPEDQRPRLAAVLDALDSSFSPLLESLPLQTEPACLLLVAPEESAA